MRIHQRGNLSPEERLEVIRIRRGEELSTRKIAERLKCSHVTIARIIKAWGDKPTPPPTIEKVPAPVAMPTPPPPLSVPKIPESRIDFRENKLKEVAGDIMATRLRGSVHVLPALHRLHLQIHDEVSTMKEEAAAVTSGMDAQALIATITQTISRLPPVLRHQLQDQLESISTPRVVSFQVDDVG